MPLSQAPNAALGRELACLSGAELSSDNEGKREVVQAPRSSDAAVASLNRLKVFSKHEDTRLRMTNKLIYSKTIAQKKKRSLYVQLYYVGMLCEVVCQFPI